MRLDQGVEQHIGEFCKGMFICMVLQVYTAGIPSWKAAPRSASSAKGLIIVRWLNGGKGQWGSSFNVER